MTDQDQANIELFQSDFVSGEHDFTAWLAEYLDRGAVYPFLMGGPQQYDLGDLLRALLPSARKPEHELLQLAFQKTLAAASHSWDLEALRVLAHAVATAGFSTIMFELANAIEVVLLKLAQANWTEDEKALAYVAVDQIVAALATFSFDGDASATRVSRMLFEQNTLAPFASSLFTPIALSDLKFWPALWRQLLAQASRPTPLFGQLPEAKWRCNPLGIDAAHFDLLHVFGDFLESAVAKEHTLQEIYSAVLADDLDVRSRESARLALLEMEEHGKIIRRAANDHDELYLSPSLIDPRREAPAREHTRVPERKRIAIVEPKRGLNWRAAAGQVPRELLAIFQTSSVTYREIRYG